MMVVALLVLAHVLTGATIVHAAAETWAGPSTAGSTVSGSAPHATSPVACHDGGACMNADRPTTNLVLLLAFALLTATLVPLVQRRVLTADGWRRRQQGPAAPWTQRVADGILLI